MEIAIEMGTTEKQLKNVTIRALGQLSKDGDDLEAFYKTMYRAACTRRLFTVVQLDGAYMEDDGKSTSFDFRFSPDFLGVALKYRVLPTELCFTLGAVYWQFVVPNINDALADGIHIIDWLAQSTTVVDDCCKECLTKEVLDLLGSFRG